MAFAGLSDGQPATVLHLLWAITGECLRETGGEIFQYFAHEAGNERLISGKKRLKKPDKQVITVLFQYV